MKIVFFIRNLAGVVGGAERAILSLAGAMAARGDDVAVATHERTAGAPHYPVPPGVDLAALHPSPRPAVYRRDGAPPKPTRTAKRRPVRDTIKRIELHNAAVRRAVWGARSDNRRVSADVAAYLDRERPEIVVVFLPTIASHVAEALRRLSADARPRSVIAFRNEPNFVLRAEPGDLDKALRAARFSDALRAYDVATVLAPEYLDQLPSEVRARAVAIPNEVDLEAFGIDAPLLTRDRRIIHVGRLVAQKRPDLLLRAFAEIAGRIPDWSLTYFGDGPLRAELEEFVRQSSLSAQVSFAGNVADISDAHRSAQIVVSPSAVEGFPRGLSEAMAAGLAPLGMADCIGVAHLLRPIDGLAESGAASEQSEGDLAGRLLRLASDDTAREAAAAAAAARVAAFGPSAVFDQWAALLHEVGSRRGDAEA